MNRLCSIRMTTFIASLLLLVLLLVADPAIAADSSPDEFEPDVRLVNFTLPHPHAEIHVPHPEELIRRRSGVKSSETGMLHEKRENVYGFYECSKPYFQGTCQWTQIPFSAFADGSGKCFNRLYGPLGSMGPDRGVSCHVYSRRDCDDTSGDQRDGFMYPGSGDCPNDPWFKSSYLSECPVSWRCRVVG